MQAANLLFRDWLTIENVAVLRDCAIAPSHGVKFVSNLKRHLVLEVKQLVLDARELPLLSVHVENALGELLTVVVCHEQVPGLWRDLLLWLWLSIG